MKLIGDVHGEFKQYKEIIRKHPDTIQVGDMGLGFRRYPHGDWVQNPPYDGMVSANARFIRGNHDNPGVCRNHSQWIPDGLVQDDVMFVGGASSIDWQYRIEGYSWWKDEQCSQDQFNEIVDIYFVTKPRVMVTHDCPLSIIPLIHRHHFKENSRTQQALQMMFEYHQPDLWVHGHHHISIDHVVEGTRFVCLAELELKEF